MGETCTNFIDSGQVGVEAVCGLTAAKAKGQRIRRDTFSLVGVSDPKMLYETTESWTSGEGAGEERKTDGVREAWAFVKDGGNVGVMLW